MDRTGDRFVQELYALPAQEFTGARNAKAAALKAAGRADEARAVRQLRRPPATLWAANQLAHVEAKGLDAFIRAVDEVRRTQLRDPRAAGDALRRQRADLDVLVNRAGELLARQGRRMTPATQRRIADTLLGAAVDRRLAQELREGRLTEELSAPGFEVLTGAPPGGSLRLIPGGKTAGEKEARAREAERRAQAEERRRRAADELEREAVARREAADAAQRELEELARKTSAARERLRDAQRAARGAAAAGRKARRPAKRRRLP